MSNHVSETKRFRKELDSVLQTIKLASGGTLKAGDQRVAREECACRRSRERSLAITKIQEAIMWLGMDLKAMKEEGVEGVENPYPESYNPDSPTIEPTADGLKL